MNNCDLLIAEDDPGTKEILPKLFELYGITTCVVDSVLEVIDILKKEPRPKYILLDLSAKRRYIKIY